ncbi:MAG: methyl-accepting chemotaxis protein [Thalassolituus sp.]|uniref:methyl-accepting chemotaxis protein n=1 Tax=Thalassolituus TaxID=187492 RepID=UPI0023F054BC|nr:methyl-accepting chemotaxis protein [Thalassolituus oleivorans]
MSLSQRSTAALAILITLLLGLFFAGQYTRNELVTTLDYITGPAWDTADGAMEATITIEREMLLLNQLFAGENIDIQQLKTAQTEAEEALNRLRLANLLDPQLITNIDSQLAQFHQAGNSLQASYKDYRSALATFDAHTVKFVAFSAIAEEEGDAAVESIAADPSYPISWDTGLAEKWQAADGGMEASIGFFQQMYFLARMTSDGVSESLQAQLNEAISFQREAVKEMLASGLFDNSAPAAYGVGSMAKIYQENLQQHVQLLNQVVVTLKNFQQQKIAYSQTSEQLLDHIGKVEEKADQQVEGRIAGIAEQQSAASATMMMILVGCLSIFIFVGYYVKTRVIKTLLEITYSLHQVANGDGDLTRRLTYNKQNELGDICRSFNSFSEKIAVIVQEVNTKSEQLAAGIDTCVNLSQRISQETASTANSASGVSKAIEQVQDGATEIARSCTHVAEETRQTESIVGRGKTEVSNTVRDTLSLVDVLDESSDLIRNLKAQADRIDRLVTVIGDISEQTNLLALNAAIEAARAGEQGRGFAVVADEVRDLATRSASSSREISEVIRTIVDSTHKAVDNMSTSAERARLSVAASQAAGVTLDQVLDHMKTVNEQIHTVAAAAEQQSQTLLGVTSDMGKMTGIAQQSSNEAIEAVNVNKHLSSLSQTLDQTMQQFKIG